MRGILTAACAVNTGHFPARVFMIGIRDSNSCFNFFSKDWKMPMSQ
jgi:hypothetical protein